jgi:large subunit ribosomal protein L18
MNKNIARLRRAKSTRAHIRELGVARLSVLRTGQHLYAQVFTADGSKVLAAANTTQTDVMEGLKNGKNADAAAKVGRIVAERAKAAGIEKVAFDRSGYRYHGRITALAEAAREAALLFYGIRAGDLLSPARLLARLSEAGRRHSSAVVHRNNATFHNHKRPRAVHTQTTKESTWQKSVSSGVAIATVTAKRRSTTA